MGIYSEIKIEIEPNKDKSSQNKGIKIFNRVRKIAKFLATQKIELAGQIIVKSEYFFSPIYDSGSCLGREIAEKDIENYLKNNDKIAKYIRRGKSEILWKNQRLNFFEVAKNVQQELPDMVNAKAEKIFDAITVEKIETLVQNADTCFLSRTVEKHLSQERKNLIQNLLIMRLELLKQTIKN